MQPVNRLLICRSDHIGDLILTLPLFASAKKAFPQVHITVLVSPLTASLLENHPDVDEVMIDDHKGAYAGAAGFGRLVKELRKGSFDSVVLPFCNWRLVMAVLAAGIPRRVANGYRLYRLFINRPLWLHRSHPPIHESKFTVAFLRPLGVEEPAFSLPKIYLTDVEIDEARDFLKRKGVNSPPILLHAGSSGSAYNLNPGEWGRIAGHVALETDSSHILLTGVQSEQVLANQIVQVLGEKAQSVAGELSLRQLCAVQSLSKLVMAPSTGPLHTAAAVGTPVLGFYPPRLSMSPEKWRPLGDQVATITPLMKECVKCVKEKCEFHPCMDRFTKVQVDEALMKIGLA